MERASSCMSLAVLGIGMLILLGVLLVVASTPMPYETRMMAVGAVIVLAIIAIMALGGV